MPNLSKPSHLNAAVELIRAKQFQEAAKLLIGFLKENPTSEDGWFLLSYTVQDPRQKTECLQRVLLLNPGHTRAQERLSRLESVSSQPVLGSKTPPPQVDITASPQPRTRSRWIKIPILLLVLAALVIGGWFALKTILPYFRQVQTPEVAVLPVDTLTPLPLITQTSTPSPLPTVTATPSPTATQSPTVVPPTPTYAFASPAGDLAQEMDNIQNQVSTLRELGILVDNPRYILPPAKVHGLLADLFLERYDRDRVTDEARVLAALGLIEPSYDLYNKIINALGEGLGGFYIPWRDELFLIGEDFSALEKVAYAHEYDHALTDQHFHLEEIGVYPECLHDTDRCLAISALVEGDATFLMYLWQQAYASENEIAEIEAAGFTPIDQVIGSYDVPPPYTIRDTFFKYFDGQLFVEYLYEQGGWAAVDAAHKNLPLSSEQILHPEKYLRAEKPDLVELIPLDDILGEDWRHLKTDTLGELTTEMVLGSSANYLTQLDPITASTAAAGWGGDQYQIYYHGKTNHTILVAQWRWDSQADGAEFWDAIKAYLNRRYVGREVEEVDQDCWTKINDHYSCVFRTSRNTLWLMAPDLAAIDLLLEQYPQFRD